MLAAVAAKGYFVLGGYFLLGKVATGGYILLDEVATELPNQSWNNLLYQVLLVPSEETLNICNASSYIFSPNQISVHSFVII